MNIFIALATPGAVKGGQGFRVSKAIEWEGACSSANLNIKNP